MRRQVIEKLEILADAAKYDASCASSGGKRENSKTGIGNSTGAGICHSYTEDGRCVSLLKVLFSNVCIYDCAYCVSRRSNEEVTRVAFTVQEVVDLTMDFYKRNYIEGLFLSSGIFGDADTTTEKLVAVARALRHDHQFNGYIHLKVIPGASAELLTAAGRLADRLSVNVEIPSEAGLKSVAPEKDYGQVFAPMATVRDGIEQAREERSKDRRAPRFAAGGQSTQLVIGATPESDRQVLELVDGLYSEQKLRRVYYSGFVALGGDDRVPEPRDLPRAVPPRAPALPGRLAPEEVRVRARRGRPARLGDAGRGRRSQDGLRPALPAPLPHRRQPGAHRVAPARARPGHPVVAADRRGATAGDGAVGRPARDGRGAQTGAALPDDAGPQAAPDRPGPRGRPRPAGRRPGGRGAPAVAVRAGARRAAAAPARRAGGVVPAALPVSPTLAVETDGSFPGLLTAYAAAYRWGALPATVRQSGQAASGALFGETLAVETDARLAGRVERGLEGIKPGLTGRLHRAFLSERPGMEVAVLRVIDAAQAEGAEAVSDWTFEPARQVAQWSGRVGREAHRMEAFVRFERLTAGDDDRERWAAVARPEYHVLPLLSEHFGTRYPTMAWRIIDARRRLALVHTPEPDRQPGEPATTIVPAGDLDLPGPAPDEAAMQSMWRAYFQAVTIPERRNLKLHLRHVPKRYWPYLTEKQEEPTSQLARTGGTPPPARAAVPARGPG